MCLHQEILKNKTLDHEESFQTLLKNLLNVKKKNPDFKDIKTKKCYSNYQSYTKKGINKYSKPSS